MKVIKLDRRHHLFHKGYKYAFKFDNWCFDADVVEREIKKIERDTNDCVFWGKSKSVESHIPYWVKPYYLGFKKETTRTMVLLSVEIK